MELITTLGINWHMLVAQLINYGVLLAVLTYFLYRPILKVVDDRRTRIKQSMDDAKKVEQEVLEMEKQRKLKLQAMDHELKEFMAKAKEQADRSRDDMVARAQKEVEQMLQKGQEQLQEEKVKFAGSLQKVVTNISVSLAEKILGREFNEADQKRLMQSIEKDLPALLK